ncbi:FAD-binding oxidoreductase [Candidatus Saganbacteria bacterium]|uniref:FAD-binding oxidoreductase n=1 Tax=Candidatus Saganbacteria bacterium TaxID=2575572 RepID=A0A9D6ULZ2_UNCSA|nr:FAD-binding oxidoreductase [Candidatus Saganbacteria bacterium]
MIKKTDPDIIKGYLEDSSNLTGGYAEGVYLPENESETAEALAECNDKKIPLTVSAGQTGTTGGCSPFGGWILSTQKLNKIIDINKGLKFAVVQPGVTLEALEKEVAKAGLFYPPDPTEKTATIGGNVATNASGGRCFRFGSTRNWIRRLKIVQPNGTSLNIKRNLFRAGRKNTFDLPHLTLPVPQYHMPLTKNAAGYFSAPGMDFLDLFIGSEGTLGVVSEIEIALSPALTETFNLVAFFPTEEAAVNFVHESKLARDASINFYEFFDENTLQMLKPSYPNIPAGAKAAIYIEQEITGENQTTYLEKHDASLDNCWIGTDPGQKEELSKFRCAVPEHINELFKQYRQTKLATDIAVPEDKFKEMFDFYNLQLTCLPAGTATYNLQLFFVKFGHIGDNHLHVNLLPKSEEELKTVKELVLSFIRKAVSLGGTVSAEHGIGKIKHAYLREMYGEAGIKEMVRIKKTFDPNCILGINNIFPKELLTI